MRAGEIKRMIGYYEPKYDQFCGNCANCKRKGTHLRCSRFKIAVQALGMCRNGWTHSLVTEGLQLLDGGIAPTVGTAPLNVTCPKEYQHD